MKKPVCPFSWANENKKNAVTLDHCWVGMEVWSLDYGNGVVTKVEANAGVTGWPQLGQSA